jgi:DNA-binding MarR family transcriptional regulator
MESYEGIATNILADRLKKLIAHGIITTEQDPSDGRRLIYVLTAKGIDLAPVLTEMVLWAARHEETENQALVRQMQTDKEQFLGAIQQRWVESMRSPRTVYKRHKSQDVSLRSVVRSKPASPSK